jgi:hypothetical protein
LVIEESGVELLASLLSDRFYLQTFGALEYLPEFVDARSKA